MRTRFVYVTIYRIGCAFVIYVTTYAQNSDQVSKSDGPDIHLYLCDMITLPILPFLRAKTIFTDQHKSF